jgi:hypothetical protein
VLGQVTRGFAFHGSPFAGGLHRGVDLAAPPGAPVGAPCGGRVVAAGRVGASGRVVTVACGPWHASVLPLASVAVRRGTHVTAGRPVGTAAGADRGPGAHVGLHLGVRRARERFGYVDPLRFMPPAHPWGPVGPPGRGDGRRRVVPAPRVVPVPRLVPAPRVVPAPRLVPAPRVVPAPRLVPAPPPDRAADRRPVAPWPVWAGVALLLAGASTGTVIRGRRSRAAGPGRLAPRTSPRAG